MDTDTNIEVDGISLK